MEQYATGLVNPRLIRTAPNGDAFVAETEKGDILIFRGISADGKPETTSVFASGLNKPFGIAFYPQGPNPKWVYIGNLDSVVRFPYNNGDLKATAAPEHIADIPGGRGHTTRDVRFTLDGKKMLVSVGSGSNVDDPDTHPVEKNRADVLEFNPDGSGMRVYAYGIRNSRRPRDPPRDRRALELGQRARRPRRQPRPRLHHAASRTAASTAGPGTTSARHQDPRHAGKHPELKDKVIVPDVLLQSHSASLGMTFYNGTAVPGRVLGRDLRRRARLLEPLAAHGLQGHPHPAEGAATPPASTRTS